MAIAVHHRTRSDRLGEALGPPRTRHHRLSLVAMSAAVPVAVLVARDGALAWRGLRVTVVAVVAVLAAVLLRRRTDRWCGGLAAALGTLVLATGVGFAPYVVKAGGSATSLAAIVAMVTGAVLVGAGTVLPSGQDGSGGGSPAAEPPSSPPRSRPGVGPGPAHRSAHRRHRADLEPRCGPGVGAHPVPADRRRRGPGGAEGRRRCRHRRPRPPRDVDGHGLRSHRRAGDAAAGMGAASRRVPRRSTRHGQPAAVMTCACTYRRASRRAESMGVVYDDHHCNL